MLLAPTHEEEITRLVAHEIRSPKHLPIRLYQIGRKYRDELRPRAGLLRGREFIMKDLYSFDDSVEAAFETYEQVREAYKRIFTRIGVPFVVVRNQSVVLLCKINNYCRQRQIVAILVDQSPMNTI